MNFNKYEGKEDDLQQICATYLNLHPKAFYCHVPNGGKRSKSEGAKFKRMGVKAGIPDILIFNPSAIGNDYYRGLAIELKVKGGKVSTHQAERLESFKKCGWFTAIVWSFDEFEHIVKMYFNEF